MSKEAEYAIPERVSAVCDELAASQINPTVKLVILRLGGGSPNDIAPLIREWKAARAQKLVEQSTAAAATEVPEVVNSAMRAVWRVAEAEIRSHGAAADKAVEDAKAQRDEAETLRLKLVAELQARDETIERLKAEVARLEGAAEIQAGELTRVGERHDRQLKEAEDRAAARLAELQARHDDLQRQLTEVKSQAKESHAQKKTAEESNTRLEKTIISTQQELAASRAETSKLDKELAKVLATAEGTQARLAEEKARYQDQEARLNEMNKALLRLAETRKDDDAVTAAGKEKK